MSTIEEPLYGELPEVPRAYLGIFVAYGLGGVGYGLRVWYGLVERSRLVTLAFLSGSGVYIVFFTCSFAMGKTVDLIFSVVGCFMCP